MGDDREAWTAYANSTGLLRDTPAPAPPAEPRTKYGARRVQVDGTWFDSTKEANRYQELKLLTATGAIAELEIQPVFPLHVVKLYRSGLPPITVDTIGTYRADFRYVDLITGEIVIEDVKSAATKTKEAYRLRKRIAEAVHGITIREVE